AREPPSGKARDHRRLAQVAVGLRPRGAAVPTLRYDHSPDLVRRAGAARHVLVPPVPTRRSAVKSVGGSHLPAHTDQMGTPRRADTLPGARRPADAGPRAL